jgi:hypothetical protein
MHLTKNNDSVIGKRPVKYFLASTHQKVLQDAEHPDCRACGAVISIPLLRISGII